MREFEFATPSPLQGLVTFWTFVGGVLAGGEFAPDGVAGARRARPARPVDSSPHPMFDISRVNMSGLDHAAELHVDVLDESHEGSTVWVVMPKPADRLRPLTTLGQEQVEI